MKSSCESHNQKKTALNICGNTNIIVITMDAESIMKLLETNGRIIATHLRCSEQAIDFVTMKRTGMFRCEECKGLKKRKLSMERNSDDGRDLSSAYEKPLAEDG